MILMIMGCKRESIAGFTIFSFSMRKSVEKVEFCLHRRGTIKRLLVGSVDRVDQRMEIGLMFE